MTRTPPKVATWLLRYFGSSSNNEHVLGDLVEQFHIRPSRSWYWGQALAAIVVSVCHGVWSHKVSTILSMLVGWACILTLMGSTNRISYFLAVHLRNWSIQPVVMATLTFPLLMGFGWLVNVIGRRQKATPLLYSFSVGIFYCIGVASMVFYNPAFATLPFIRQTEITLLLSTINVVITIGIMIGGGVFRMRRDRRIVSG